MKSHRVKETGTCSHIYCRGDNMGDLLFGQSTGLNDRCINPLPGVFTWYLPIPLRHKQYEKGALGSAKNRKSIKFIHRVEGKKRNSAKIHETLMGSGCRSVPTDHRSVPTDHRSVPTDHRSMSTDHRSVPTDHRNMSTDHRNMSTDHRSVPTDHRSMSTNHRSMPDYFRNIGGCEILEVARSLYRTCSKRYIYMAQTPRYKTISMEQPGLADRLLGITKTFN